MPRTFAGRCALVTGASSGIGLALAESLCQKGARVCLVARRRPRLEEIASRLRSQGADVDILSLDLTDREKIESAFRTYDSQQPVDYLFNNAGAAYCNDIENTSDDWYESLMNINYFATVWGTRTLLPSMRARGRGHIINVSSVEGFVGTYGYSAYAPSKFAVMGFSEVLRNEICSTPLRVSVLCPPDTETPQLEFENRTKPIEAKAIAQGAGRLTAEQVAEACLKGVLKGRFIVLPNRATTAVYRWKRLIPEVVNSFLEREIRRARNASPKK